jgi:hypothetical protein
LLAEWGKNGGVDRNKIAHTIQFLNEWRFTWKKAETLVKNSCGARAAAK